MGSRAEVLIHIKHLRAFSGISKKMGAGATTILVDEFDIDIVEYFGFVLPKWLISTHYIIYCSADAGAVAPLGRRRSRR